MNKKGIALFAAGALFGLEGIKLLSSEDAKKVYTKCTAGVLRVKNSILDQVTTLQENCSDIYEEAKAINEERENKKQESEVPDLADTADREDVKEEKETSEQTEASGGAEAAGVAEASEEV